MTAIDDTNIVTYKSDNCVHTDLTWVAYIVLPNGEFWGVRFNGATEEIARTKAIALWNKEQEKFKKQSSIWNDVPDDGETKQHHFANKVWMRHKETRDLVRVPLTEITMYERNGYERSGPRAK